MLKSLVNVITIIPKSRVLSKNVGKQLFDRVLTRNVCLTSASRAKDDRKLMLKSMPVADEGTEGEQFVDIDTVLNKENIFPDQHTPNMLFNGVPFKDIPICNIRVSKNNTILTVTESNGLLKIMHSSGREGFKNAKKGTNIAAQAAAISLSAKALQQGYHTVRVRVQGLGPGRMSAIKGLQMGGLNIISITDSTRVSSNPPRPPKARSL